MSEKVPKPIISEEESKSLVQEFFGLFGALRAPKQSFSAHPSRDQIEAYVSSPTASFKDVWHRPSLEQDSMDQHPSQWTLSQMAWHLQRCAKCSKALAKLRASRKRSNWFEEHFCAFGVRGQRARAWALTYATAVIILVALTLNLNLNLNMAPQPTSPRYHQSAPMGGFGSLYPTLNADYDGEPTFNVLWALRSNLPMLLQTVQPI